MFAAAIKLRYKKPNIARAYKIPFGNVGIWVTAGLGCIAGVFTLLIGFVPPGQLATGSTIFYLGFLIGAVLIACLAPSVILRFKKPIWKIPLPHEKEESK